MSEENDTVIFSEEIANSVSIDLDLNEKIPLDYTDPEAVELDMSLDLRLKDSAGNLWKIAEEDSFMLLHLIREDGA